MKPRREAAASFRLRRSFWLAACVTQVMAASWAWAEPDVAASVQSASAPAPASRETWALRLPEAERVAFHGVVSFDNAGVGTLQMLYPAPGGAALLAAVLTHGLIVSGEKQKQKERLQADADRLLEPFQAVLKGYSNERLFEEGGRRMTTTGSKRLIRSTEGPGDDWVIESTPIFSMTQDRRGLILDDIVLVYPPHASKPLSTQTVRVVSLPLTPAPAVSASASASASERTGDSEVLAWMDHDGQRLIDESAAMFAESLDIAVGNAVARVPDGLTPQRTFRFPVGGEEKIERAELVSEHCGRSLLRTLRGALLSIPAGAGAREAACAKTSVSAADGAASAAVK